LEGCFCGADDGKIKVKMRKVVCILAVLVLVGCTSTSRKPTFWDNFSHLPRCPELANLETTDSMDILVRLSPTTTVYERSNDAKWKQIEPKSLPDVLKNKRILLAVPPDAPECKLFEQFGPALESCTFFLLCHIGASNGYASLQIYGEGRRSVVVMFGKAPSKSLQQSMRDHIQRFPRGTYPDGTSSCFFIIQPSRDSSVWKIGDAKVEKAKLFEELRRFEEWRKKSGLPPLACDFAPAEDTTVQDVVNEVVNLHKLGIKRVDIIRVGGIPY
jgi:hypothetical protein